MQITARQVQWGLCGALLLGVGAAAVTLVSASVTKVVPRNTSAEAAIWRELEEFLASLERAWNPRDRERLLEAKRPRAETLMPAFARLLRDEPKHELAAVGLEVVGRFGLVDLHRAVEDLVWDGPDALRPAAVRAADELQPWQTDDLVYLLEEEDEAVRLAAYEIACRRADGPWRTMFEQLLWESPEVQRAVQESLPEALPPAAVDALASSLREAGPQAAVSLIAALGRGPRTAQAETLLLGCLQHGEPEVLTATLQALQARPLPLSDPLPVWEVVEDARWSDGLRASALLCLERTASFDADRVRSAATMLPPWTRYQAARCLLRAGDRTGVDLLVELLYHEGELTGTDAGEMNLPTDEERHAVAQASRRLLSWLSGLSPNTPRDEFQYWAANGSGRWNGKHLPASPLW